MVKWVWAIRVLQAEENEVIFWNEFSFPSVASRCMDCRRRGGRQYERSALIALVEVSWWRFLKTIIMDCTEQTGFSKAEDFVKFILNIKYAFTQVVTKKTRFAICWDNDSIHKGDWVRRYCEDGFFLILFITSYSLWMNPVEKLKGWVKAKMSAAKQKVGKFTFIYHLSSIKYFLWIRFSLLTIKFEKSYHLSILKNHRKKHSRWLNSYLAAIHKSCKKNKTVFKATLN